MNQRFLIGIIILVGIGSIGSVLAYTGTISANQGNFNNVLVTGTCTGCGGESSFTNYNTIQFNNTLGLGIGDSAINNFQINNDGTIISDGTVFDLVVNKTGSVLFNHSGYSVNGGTAAVQSSSTGKYQVIINDDATPIIDVFKSSVLLQHLGIHMAQFTTPQISRALGISISPDGHYIAILGKDSGGTDDRLLILRGS